MSVSTTTFDGVLNRTCPWCLNRWSRGGCGCLPAPAGRPLQRVVDGLDLTLAIHRYDPVIQRFLLDAKNGSRRDLLAVLGRQLGLALTSDIAARDATVVWVPASFHGRRRRGYDQARLLARAVGYTSQRSTKPLLARGGTGSQARRDRSSRLNGLAITCRTKNAPREVVVIDDVVTTGASLTAAAEALRAAGCQRVVGLCVASVE